MGHVPAVLPGLQLSIVPPHDAGSYDAAAARDVSLQEPPPGGEGGQRRSSTLTGAQ